MKHLISIAFAALTVAACASIGVPTPKSTSQGLYEAETAYAAALAVAVQYAGLPQCGAMGATAICSSPSVVDRLKKADAVAEPALQAAVQAVQTPGFGTDAVATVVASAEASVQAFVAITTTLKVK